MVPSVVFPLEDARLPLDRGFTHNVGKTAINHSQKHDHFDRWYKLTIPRKSWVIYDIVWPAGDWIHVLRSSGDGKDQDRLGRAHHLFGPSWHSWRYRELLNDLGIEGPALRHSTCVFYIRRTSRANEDIFWTFSLSCRGCLLFFFHGVKVAPVPPSNNLNSLGQVGCVSCVCWFDLHCVSSWYSGPASASYLGVRI